MRYALGLLEEQLEKLSTPNECDDEDDIYDAVIYMRQTTDLKLAIKILKQQIANSEEIYNIKGL